MVRPALRPVGSGVKAASGRRHTQKTTSGGEFGWGGTSVKE